MGLKIMRNRLFGASSTHMLFQAWLVQNALWNHQLEALAKGFVI